MSWPVFESGILSQNPPFPWRSLVSLLLALTAQRLFDPPLQPILGILLYLAALALTLWAFYRGEWPLCPPPADDISRRDPLTWRLWPLPLSFILLVLAFLYFGGNRFTPTNLFLWLAGAALFIGAFWLRGAPFKFRKMEMPGWNWLLLMLAATALVVFFRVYHLQQTPAEPFSDHAEKLLDVYDVTQGQTHIFFPRNTGREAIQMYWTVLISWIFGTGLSFLSLKIGTALFGLFTLPYMYLLGKEIAGPRVGLLAFIFTGIGYWPNVISRIGLRFPLYPLFAVATLFHLMRGLRTRSRNDFILSGLFLGLGLHGYTPFRIVPLLVVVAFLLYIAHAQSQGVHRQALLWLLLVCLMALILFLPLLRYLTEHPGDFFYRSFSRLGLPEQPLLWIQVFLSNTWNALRMFNWDDGDIWVNSMPHRPALDVVSGALFLIGIALVLARYIQKRHWSDLFLLLSIPVLLLPSIFSLAFPKENPALNRAGGVLVPAFLFVAIALDGLLTGLGSGLSEAGKRLVTWGVTGVLLCFSAAQNFDIVFRQFDQNYRNGAWNSSEIGAVIRQFGLVYGETDTVWIVPFPYWVDTRLPGTWAGIPKRDFAMPRDNLADTVELPGPKLFIVKASLQEPHVNDQQTLEVLKRLYPQGSLSLHQSPVPRHDFWIYFVPAQQ